LEDRSISTCGVPLRNPAGVVCPVRGAEVAACCRRERVAATAAREKEGAGMKIAVAGSHGTGKTTLARMLADALGLPLITERAREAARQMKLGDLGVLLRDRNMAQSFQALVWELQTRAEEEMASFVSDRCVYDVLAYCLFYGLEDTAWYRWAEGEVRGRARYDAVVYVPVEFLPEDDGFRFVCPGCQRFVDALVRELLASVGSQERIVTASGLTPEERLHKVLAQLRRAA